MWGQQYVVVVSKIAGHVVGHPIGQHRWDQVEQRVASPRGTGCPGRGVFPEGARPRSYESPLLGANAKLTITRTVTVSWGPTEVGGARAAAGHLLKQPVTRCQSWRELAQRMTVR